MINRWASGGLFARITWIVVCGFLLLHVAGYFFYGHERMVGNARTFAMGVAERGLALDAVLSEQPDLIPHFQSPVFQVARVVQAPPPPARRWPHNDEIVSVVRRHLADLGMTGPDRAEVYYTSRPGEPRLLLVLPSAGGGFLQITALTRLPEVGYGSPVGAAMSLVLLLLVASVLWVSRRQTRQLARFVEAAETLGHGRNPAALPEAVGPRELRRASVAFNRMQGRVLDLLAERSQMLASLSHDLRTLCTRLGLRLENMPDGTQRDKAQAEIQFMTGVLDQALTFTRDEQSDEVWASVDMASLLESVTDDLLDASHPVELAVHARPAVRAQPLAVSRLLLNLIDNGIKYGGAARVDLYDDRLEVSDPGQGFDAAKIEAALRPYVRLQPERSQNVPGSGLGLSIAANVCRRHGWDLAFDRLEDGFVVTVRFRRDG